MQARPPPQPQPSGRVEAPAAAPAAPGLGAHALLDAERQASLALPLLQGSSKKLSVGIYMALGTYIA